MTGGQTDVFSSMVPGGGVEPPRPEGRRILRPFALTPKPLLSYKLQRLAEMARCVW
jgi:hypothetical protein